MQKVSVVLAVFNEEANLGRCLESASDLASEFVIVDGGSTDKTIEIAKKFKAKIIRTTNPKIFHINKNKAIDAATCDWVLQLDADEALTIELIREVKQAIETGKYSGYWIPRKNYFLGRYLTKGGQYPDYTLRLYQRGKGRLPAKDVHEQAVVTGEVGYLKNPLLHIRDKNFSEYLMRLNRYTDLIASQLVEQGVTVSFVNSVIYLVWKPTIWFMKAYIRHRGYVDGFPGFVFALFSALRFAISYIKIKDYEDRH